MLTHIAAATIALAIAHPSLAQTQLDQRHHWPTDADTSPAPREHAAVFHDPAHNRVILYAGSGYNPQMRPLDDAWAYNPTDHTWTPLQVRGDAPTGGSIRVAQPPTNAHAFTFGGYDATFTTNNDLRRVTFHDDAIEFTPIDQTNPPAPRALHALAYDAPTNRLALAHGVSQSGFFADTHLGAFNDDGSVTWTQLEQDAAPAARFGSATAFDHDTGHLLVVSGQAQPTQTNPMAMTNDAWSLDLRADEPTWSPVNIDGYEGRRNPCWAWSQSHRTLAIWCGTADGRTNVEGLTTLTHTDDGWSLTQHDDTNHDELRRSSGFGFEHPDNGHPWLGFGNNASAQFVDWIEVQLPN